MENIKDILDNFDELSFTEKLVLKKRLRIDTFIAERKGDTLQSIGINLMLVGKYFYSVGKKEFWFFPLNENDYNTYLKWIFANEYLDYNSFDTLKKNFLDRFDKHRFKEKLISELILEYERRLSGEIQGSTFNWLRNKEYYKLGVVLFEEGSELNYNHFKSFYYKKWSDDATLALSGTFTEILSCFLKGYFECQFYLFLIEQQKRLLKGEDITRPFEAEEKEKPIKLTAFHIAVINHVKENLGINPLRDINEDEEIYFEKVLKGFKCIPSTYHNPYYKLNRLNAGSRITETQFKKLRFDVVLKYFKNDIILLDEAKKVINKIQSNIGKK